VYTRWGHYNCPPNSRRLYHGVMSGTLWTIKGAGANFLCMPVHNSYYGAPLLYRNRIRGNTFIQPVTYAHPLKGRDFFHQIACAVCQANYKTSTVMIPGRSACPAGWTRQYYGYIMTEYGGNDNSRYQFECIDKNMIPAASGKKHGGVALRKVGTSKGMPSGYRTNKEVNCVLCAK